MEKLQCSKCGQICEPSLSIVFFEPDIERVEKGVQGVEPGFHITARCAFCDYFLKHLLRKDYLRLVSGARLVFPQSVLSI